MHWDYSGGSHGPGGWGDLKAEWGVCKSGSRQSPIAITALDLVTDRSLGKLDAKYRKRVHATLYNSGHGAEVSAVVSEVLPWRCGGYRGQLEPVKFDVWTGGQACRLQAAGLLLRSWG